MAPNEHLLDNFSACNETRTLAGQLLREAQVKTAAGSGHEIGALTTGLPAVCILIASERLNNGDVTKKAAQAAACLKPKDFSKVYTQVQLALGTTTTQSPSFRLRHKNEPLRELPSKDSPSKRPANASQKRRSSDAVDRELPTKDSPEKRQVNTLQKRSSSNATIRELPSKDSPIKRQANALQKRSSSDAMDIEKSLPETPTKKRKFDCPSSPALLSKPIFSPTPSSSRTTINVTPVKRPETAIPSINAPSSPLKRSLPLMNATLDLPSSLQESDTEDLPPPRRFRPVYLDCKQWNARDPRLAQIWKKAAMHKQALIKQCGDPFDRYRHVDVEMDQEV